MEEESKQIEYSGKIVTNRIRCTYCGSIIRIVIEKYRGEDINFSKKHRVIGGFKNKVTVSQNFKGRDTGPKYIKKNTKTTISRTRAYSHRYAKYGFLTICTNAKCKKYNSFRGISVTCDI